MTTPTDHKPATLSSRPLGEIHFEGNIGGAPTYVKNPGASTKDGWTRLSFSVASTKRKKDPDSGQWIDASEPVWYRCTLWNGRADALRDLLTSGLSVKIVGELIEAPWRKEDGTIDFAYDVNVTDISLLPWRLASVTHKARAEPIPPNDQPLPPPDLP